jgi:hypothetical protein
MYLLSRSTWLPGTCLCICRVCRSYSVLQSISTRPAKRKLCRLRKISLFDAYKRCLQLNSASRPLDVLTKTRSLKKKQLFLTYVWCGSAVVDLPTTRVPWARGFRCSCCFPEILFKTSTPSVQHTIFRMSVTATCIG